MNAFISTTLALSALVAVSVSQHAALAGSLQAPPGLFKDLNDQIVGNALILNGKQLFIDDHLIEELSGAQKVLNQPVKHPRNPLLIPEQPWESIWYDGTSVIYDEEDRIFKMWYLSAKNTDGVWTSACLYATSRDGLTWHKPIVNEEAKNNVVFSPNLSGGGFGVFKDPHATEPLRRYKMLHSDYPDGTAKTACTNAAYSPDGIRWTPEPNNPLIPFVDTQSCPYWDSRRQRYVAYLRFGPPNTRLISRVESKDFVHWSPKVTVIRRTKIDDPFITNLYGMRILPYEGLYIGLIDTYHGETIEPIPDENQAWMDKVNIQLAFSRDGLTWQRVGKHGAIAHAELSQDNDWKTIADQATFVPYGEHGKDWDWGQIYGVQAPLMVGDEHWIYYVGIGARHWWDYHGDVANFGIGLATLRRDGFVSIDAGPEGVLITPPLVFIGDSLELNANAAGGSIAVEALTPDGSVIDGFTTDVCTPITSDNVRHVIEWNGSADCHQLQARPLKLRFHLSNAKLYSFTPRIRHKHYVPSYD